MGLYLCVFDDEDEIEGVEVGSYAYYNSFRDYISATLESRRPGSRFPILMNASDSDGSWSVEESEQLIRELTAIAAELKAMPPIPLEFPEQSAVARSIGLEPQSAFESFVDVDGEFLLDRLSHLASVAVARSLPILFQ